MIHVILYNFVCSNLCLIMVLAVLQVAPSPSIVSLIAIISIVTAILILLILSMLGLYRDLATVNTTTDHVIMLMHC